jgi:hypothetical protein
MKLSMSGQEKGNLLIQVLNRGDRMSRFDCIWLSDLLTISILDEGYT